MDDIRHELEVLGSLVDPDHVRDDRVIRFGSQLNKDVFFEFRAEAFPPLDFTFKEVE